MDTPDISSKECGPKSLRRLSFSFSVLTELSRRKAMGTSAKWLCERSLWEGGRGGEGRGGEGRGGEGREGELMFRSKVAVAI